MRSGNLRDQQASKPTTSGSLLRRSQSLALLLLLLGALVLFSTAAHAGVYTVTMKNGTSFETRYEPVPAEWDENISMIRTDVGNWIALETSEIADVTADVEASGFGYQLDTTTIFLGWSPNDLVTENEDGEMVQEYGYLDDPVEGGADYTLEQFVDPVSIGTGGNVGGIPLSYYSEPTPDN